MTGHQRGETNGNWRGGKVENICEDCGNTFLTFPSQQRRYCSSICQGRKHPCVCEVCKITFYRHRSQIAQGEGRTCSRKCMGIWKSQSCIGERGANWRGGCTIEVSCRQCGEPFTTTKSKRKNGRGKFCSTECYNRYFSENYCRENSYGWRGGTTKYPRGWKRALREQIRERDGRECQICGSPENGHKHHVHHIDYDRENLALTNLITLCRSCHGRTNQHRDQWQTQLVAHLEVA